MKKLPFDVEASLPDYMKQSVETFKNRCQKSKTDPSYTEIDLDILEFSSDINNFEVNGIISSDVAWYLREKYLGITRGADYE